MTTQPPAPAAQSPLIKLALRAESELEEQISHWKGGARVAGFIITFVVALGLQAVAGAHPLGMSDLWAGLAAAAGTALHEVFPRVPASLLRTALNDAHQALEQLESTHSGSGALPAGLQQLLQTRTPPGQRISAAAAALQYPADPPPAAVPPPRPEPSAPASPGPATQV